MCVCVGGGLYTLEGVTGLNLRCLVQMFIRSGDGGVMSLRGQCEAMNSVGGACEGALKGRCVSVWLLSSNIHHFVFRPDFLFKCSSVSRLVTLTVQQYLLFATASVCFACVVHHMMNYLAR